MIINYDDALAEVREGNDIPLSMVTRAKQHFDLEPEFEKRVDWDWLMEHWVKNDRVRLRDLTILVMRESCGMKLATIGQLFNVHKATVMRRANKAKYNIRKIVMDMADERDLNDTPE